MKLLISTFKNGYKSAVLGYTHPWARVPCFQNESYSFSAPVLVLQWPLCVYGGYVSYRETELLNSFLTNAVVSWIGEFAVCFLTTVDSFSQIIGSQSLSS